MPNKELCLIPLEEIPVRISAIDMKSKRPRATRTLLKVPPLNLSSGGGGGGEAHSAPTPVVQPSTRIVCPLCKHDTHVYEWADWVEQNVVVYGCAYRHRTTGKLCANRWIEKHRDNTCRVCEKPARIQERGKAKDGYLLGYWCDKCQDFSQANV